MNRINQIVDKLIPKLEELQDSDNAIELKCAAADLQDIYSACSLLFTEKDKDGNFVKSKIKEAFRDHLDFITDIIQKIEFVAENLDELNYLVEECRAQLKDKL